MKNSKWKVYGAWILLTEAVGGLAALLTRQGMDLYNETATQPPLAPPMAVFPVVWGVLYALMGIGIARVWLSEGSEARDKGINRFIIQLFVNFMWSIIFFNFRAYGFAFWWLLLLWVLVARMIFTFHKVDEAAAWLQVPYLVWLTFAAYLNGAVWFLNR